MFPLGRIPLGLNLYLSFLIYVKSFLFSPYKDPFVSLLFLIKNPYALSKFWKLKQSFAIYQLSYTKITKSESSTKAPAKVKSTQPRKVEYSRYEIIKSIPMEQPTSSK